MIDAVTVDWTLSHDASDDHEEILGLFAGYRDEGPVIVVEQTLRRDGPHRHPSVWIFEDVSRYLAHLVQHACELRGERWAGIVRGSARVNGIRALSALNQIKLRLAPPPRSKPGPSRISPTPATKYGTVEQFPATDDSIRLVFTGEACADVLAALPALAELTDTSPEDNG